MDISAVTVSSVLVSALTGNVKLLFGTDIDFALVEQGRYVMYKMINGKRVLADDDNSDKVITALVMFVAQWEGILDAVDTLKKSGKPDARIKLILEDLFFRNAEVLLGVNSK